MPPQGGMTPRSREQRSMIPRPGGGKAALPSANEAPAERKSSAQLPASIVPRLSQSSGSPLRPAAAGREPHPQLIDEQHGWRHAGEHQSDRAPEALQVSCLNSTESRASFSHRLLSEVSQGL